MTIAIEGAAACDAPLYSRGWVLPDQIGVSDTVFFGADVREASVDWVRDQVSAMAAVPAVDDEDDRPVGLFVVEDERGHVNVWEIDDGRLGERAAPELKWLDKP